jgi:hypothetical protein
LWGDAATAKPLDTTLLPNRWTGLATEAPSTTPQGLEPVNLKQVFAVVPVKEAPLPLKQVTPEEPAPQSDDHSLAVIASSIATAPVQQQRSQLANSLQQLGLFRRPLPLSSMASMAKGAGSVLLAPPLVSSNAPALRQ